MKGAAWAMGSAKRFSLAEKALGAGRLVANKDHKITTLPWPGSKWTSARDIPEPPKETFRQWWTRNHQGDAR